MKNNDNFTDSLTISYLSLLAEYDNFPEFTAKYRENTSSIEKLSNKSKRPTDFTNISKIINYLKQHIEKEVRK